MYTEQNIKTALNYMKEGGILEERVPHCMKLTLADFVRAVLESGCFREDRLTNPEVLVRTVRDLARTMSENLFEDYKSDEAREWGEFDADLSKNDEAREWGRFDADLSKRFRRWLDSSFPAYKDSTVCGQADASTFQYPTTRGYVKIKESDRNIKLPDGYVFTGSTQNSMPDDSFQ